MWRVGFLSPRSRPAAGFDGYQAFLDGMRELGYVEGRNVVFEFRAADGDRERLHGLAAELVRLRMDVIVTVGSPATSAAQKATAAIPIVIGSAGDPVGSGFVKSLARPGGNITGLSNVTSDISAKHLEMLVGTRPSLSEVTVLTNPGNSSHPAILKNVQDAAPKLKLKVRQLEARTAAEIGSAFSRLTGDGAGALIVANDPLFNSQSRQIAELAAKHQLPSVAGVPEYVAAGGLMSYGQNPLETFRRSATYVDKIIKGAKPGDLPVEQPTKFELIINGRTAKALGLTIPQSLLISADRVIE